MKFWTYAKLPMFGQTGQYIAVETAKSYMLYLRENKCVCKCIELHSTPIGELTVWYNVNSQRIYGMDEIKIKERLDTLSNDAQLAAIKSEQGIYNGIINNLPTISHEQYEALYKQYPQAFDYVENYVT